MSKHHRSVSSIIGTQVQGGKPGTEDYDVGDIVAIEGRVQVCWSNGTVTWEDLKGLSEMPPCTRCSHRRYNVITKQCTGCGLEMP